MDRIDCVVDYDIGVVGGGGMWCCYCVWFYVDVVLFGCCLCVVGEVVCV